MISKFPIANAQGAAKYHDRSFTQDGLAGADNYYLNELAVATWTGRGAQILGLAGQPVTRKDFVEVLEGRVRNPLTGEIQELSKNSKGESRRAGLDFTVSPPKSVSVLALVGKDERIVRAHQAANSAAIDWLEANASLVRIRDGDKTRAVQANNLTVATVVHETNRLNEPQLHSHNVIAAVVYDEERGRWRSLTNDGLLRLRAQADIVYKRELASGLQQAGYELVFARNGVDFEIAGVSAEQIRGFSGRSAEIAAALKARGIDPNEASYEARAAATVDSRSKKVELPRADLHEAWRETAQILGLPVDALVQEARDRAPNNVSDRTQIRRRALTATGWAIEHLAEREQSFSQVDLETSALKFERQLTIGDVRWAVAQHRSQGFLVDRGANDSGDRLLTTQTALREEERLIGHIKQGRGRRNVVLSSVKVFDTALADYEERLSAAIGSPFRLSSEQRVAARHVLMHPDSFQGVQGAAGTGKTAALGFVKDVAETRGWKVMGIATTGSAAKELEDSAGISSQTIASFLAERRRATALLAGEIAQLKRDIREEKRQAAGATAPSVERTRLEVSNGETGRSAGMETNDYAFDHRRGSIFRGTNTFINLIGNFLLDTGLSLSERASRLGESDSLGKRLEHSMLRMGAGLAGSLGGSVMAFEQVGVAEGVSARSALYLRREFPQGSAAHKLRLKEAELLNLQRFGNAQGRKTLLVMDEASMTGVRDARKIATLARSIDARVVFQGDTKQHGSVSAGRGFEQAQQAGMHTSVLEETRRFDNATERVKAAMQDIRVGKFAAALARMDTLEVPANALAESVADRYSANLRQLVERGAASPTVGVVALTNSDRKAINAAVHARLASDGVIHSTSFRKGHLDDPKLTTAERAHAGQLEAAAVDRIIFHRDHRRLGVKGGEALEVVRYDVPQNRLVVRSSKGREIGVPLGGKAAFRVARQEFRDYSVGDRVELRAKLQLDGGLEPLANGTRGIVTHIDGESTSIRWASGRRAILNNAQMQNVDHAYAHTTFKEQGATLDREIIAVSDIGARIINQKATYVAISRARDNTEIVTSDRPTMLKNAGVNFEKSTALEPGDLTAALSDANLRIPPATRVMERTRSLDQGFSF